jgi:hypothetical protein
VCSSGTDPLDQDHLRRDRADPGKGVEPGHRGDQLAEVGVDRILHGGDVGADAVDPGQHPGEQERVVTGEPAGQRLDQPIGPGPQPAAAAAQRAGLLTEDYRRSGTPWISTAWPPSRSAPTT